MQACSLIRVIKHRLSEMAVNLCIVLCPIKLFAYGVMSSKALCLGVMSSKQFVLLSGNICIFKKCSYYETT